jgi:hypothetical protein
MKKRQHYVLREYLRSWAKNDKIFCLQDNEIFHPNLINVAQEKYFYQLHKISYHDIIWLRKIFIEDQPKLLQQDNEEWLKLYNFIFELQDNIGLKNSNNENLIQLINTQIKTMGEEIHSQVESIGLPLLNQVRQGKIDFAKNDRDMMHFFYYISEQYFRTKRMKMNFIDFHPEIFEDFDSCWNVCAHMLATNLGYNLYRERAKSKLLFFCNYTEIPFITGDQPIINTFAQNDRRPLKEAEFELFYPLKPTLALVIADKTKYNSSKINISDSAVTALNKKIFSSSYKQIYAESEDILQIVKNKN